MKKIMTKSRLIFVLLLTAAIIMSIVAISGVNKFAFADDVDTPQNYFDSDFDTRNEVLDDAKELNAEIYGEGVTLLKNEGNALPLGTGAKISIFGKNSVNMINGGSGAGSGGGGAVVSLTEALTSAGFSLNPSLINFYSNNSLSGSGRGTAPSNGNVTPGYNTGETPVSMYTEDVESTYAQYNDAAIVVISRISGEGFDLPRTMKWNGSTYGSWGTDATQLVPGARSVDDHYLQLDQNESDLIKYCGEHFDKVIVLLNTGSQFETGFLDDAGHYGYHENTKAALWIGYPGSTGLNALAKILKGEINPSGKTVDTWARDFKADPVWKNHANNMMEGNSSLKGNQYENLPASGGNGGGGYRNNYVLYKEGIYMGYRYYETRGYEEGFDTPYTGSLECGTETTEWDSWYDAHVVYPFGHGLSYTSFSQELISSEPADASTLGENDTVKFTVKVTNTGVVAGKDVVQVYYTAPYISGEVEKAHVVLGGFEKTKLLAPEESETVTVEIKVRDMASYDWNDDNTNDHKGYELDAGEYKVRLMRNAHDEIASVTYNITNDIKYSTDGATGNSVENRFDEVSEYIPSYSEYMSRTDFEGTFPTTDYKLNAPEWVINGLKEWDNRDVSKDEEQPYYTDEMPTMGVDSGLVLEDMIGVAYDDPKWDTFMDQMTKEQMFGIVQNGSYNSGQNIPELGITREYNADGPAGFIYGAPSGTYSFWCCDTVLASTWNKELGYEKGRAMGNEALWGNGSSGSRIPGWYAPAVNIHRSPFSGRNFEYYSEDGYLTGMMSANVVRGAQDKGLFCYVKHFGLNDQETNRCGVLTWADEQTMREIYFKPFELCVKVGETLGIMSSLNRIGYTWTGGSYELLTELLRNEWGFNGCVVTDSYIGDGSGLSNIDQMVRAGGNLALGVGTLSYNKDSATAVTAVRNAVQGLLYAHANSMAMNELSYPTAPKPLASFDGKTLKVAVMGAAYSESVATALINDELYPDVPDSEIAYSVAVGSTLPKGLTLSADGILSGVPEEELNNYRFTLAATYADYTKTADFIISVINSSGSIIYEAETDLGNVTIGEACEVSVAYARIYKPDATQDEIDRFPPVTYSLKDASALPEGLTLGSDGKITGTPTKECENYSFTVLASALGYKDTELTFTIDVYNSMEFTAKALKTGKFGVGYLDRVSIAETDGNVTYTLKEGNELPDGLSLTADGYIVGTPKETVTDYKFTVVASASFAVTQEAEYSISIGIAFNSVKLPDGISGKEYSARVDTAQGAGNVKYTIKEGSSLPEGLTLSSDGIISGKTKAGVYEVTVVASADGKVSDEITFTLYIANSESGCSGSVGMAGTFISVSLVLAGIVVVTVLRKFAKKND